VRARGKPSLSLSLSLLKAVDWISSTISNSAKASSTRAASSALYGGIGLPAVVSFGHFVHHAQSEQAGGSSNNPEMEQAPDQERGDAPEQQILDESRFRIACAHQTLSPRALKCNF
jgi:hypothetical protein